MTPTVDYICYYCKKKYKHQSSWSRHVIKCEKVHKNIVDSDQEDAINIALHAIQKNPKIEKSEKKVEKVARLKRGFEVIFAASLKFCCASIVRCWVMASCLDLALKLLPEFSL